MGVCIRDSAENLREKKINLWGERHKSTRRFLSPLLFGATTASHRRPTNFALTLFKFSPLIHMYIPFKIKEKKNGTQNQRYALVIPNEDVETNKQCGEGRMTKAILVHLIYFNISKHINVWCTLISVREKHRI